MHDWGSDVFLKAAIHEWQIPAEFHDLSEYSLQPKKQEDIFIVGESFSMPDKQGWVEGACKTAERMLVLKRGIKRLQGTSRQDFCRTNPFAMTQGKDDE